MINSVFKYINSDDYEVNITDKKLHVLNYKKILDLSSSIIGIKLNNKTILIKGSNLNIRKLDDRELFIIGDIKGIDFDEG